MAKKAEVFVGAKFCSHPSVEAEMAIVSELFDYKPLIKAAVDYHEVLCRLPEDERLASLARLESSLTSWLRERGIHEKADQQEHDPVPNDRPGHRGPTDGRLLRGDPCCSDG